MMNGFKDESLSNRNLDLSTQVNIFNKRLTSINSAISINKRNL